MRRGFDAAAVTKTLELLHARISERFPNAGLADVCAELVENARTMNGRAAGGGGAWIGRSRFGDT